MSTPRGIFENYPEQPSVPQQSPFFVKDTAAQSPFAAAENERTSKIPQRRTPAESPFQAVNYKQDFGYEAAPASAAASPFSVVPATQPAQPAPSPFTIAQETPRPAAQNPAYGNPAWQAAQPPQTPALTPTEAALAAFSTPPAPAPVQTSSIFSAAPESAKPSPQPSTPPQNWSSDSSSIRQLELRAIFGVNREMNADELLQRARALPGIRAIARVSADEINSVEMLKTLLSSLNFGLGSLKLHSEAGPIEFVRDGNVLLAVQTEGDFAPGVKETLIIAARELNRM